MSNLPIDLKRKFLHSNSDPSAYVKVALNRRDPAKGYYEVSLLNITDGKYQELENTYVAMVEVVKQADLAKDEALAAEARKLKRPLKALEIMEIEKAYAKPIAEAQYAFYQCKKEFCRYAVADIKPFTYNGTEILPKKETITEEIDGQLRLTEVISNDTLDALAKLNVGYGTKRYPAITNLFEVAYDYQNGITTTADTVWAEANEAKAELEKEAASAKKALESNVDEEPNTSSPLG